MNAHMTQANVGLASFKSYDVSPKQMPLQMSPVFQKSEMNMVKGNPADYLGISQSKGMPRAPLDQFPTEARRKA